jgi:hypothetical protein
MAVNSDSVDSERVGPGYQVRCTLRYGDIYGQILIWLLLTFLSLATAAALTAAGRFLSGLAVVGLILALSFPFLLFAFATTLASHVILIPRQAGTKMIAKKVLGHGST